MNEVVRGKAKSWGARINVPKRVLQYLELKGGEDVSWSLTEREGKKVAILSKEV